MGKYAVLVGINQYADPKNNLAGCINDITNMRNELLKRGFKAPDIRVVTDSRATKNAISMRLAWLVANRNAGDVLFFHFSGHGAQIRDRNMDELDDSLDEIICPHDLNWDNPLSDDKIRTILARKNPDAKLTMFMDCCHSASNTRGMAKTVSRRVIPPVDILFRSDSLETKLPIRRISRVVTEGTAIQGLLTIAACQDDQTAADAMIDGLPQGAMTALFLKSLQKSPQSPIADLISETTKSLSRARFTQKPHAAGHISMINGKFLE